MKPPREPITVEEAEAIKAISPGVVTYPVGGFHKRFARNMQYEKELTRAQRSCLWSTLYRFRRQISDKKLVAMAKRFLETEERGDQFIGIVRAEEEREK